MLNLKEVEEAKAIMIEAVHWSVMKWLGEKKKVRKAADLANGVLDDLDQEVKATWPAELKAAYDELAGDPSTNGKKVKVDAATKALAAKIKQADDEAYKAHVDAEDMFDRAEKRLSTSMAREGTRLAILSWDLREKAIMLSQSAVTSK